MRFKIAVLKWHLCLSGANELICTCLDGNHTNRLSKSYWICTVHAQAVISLTLIHKNRKIWATELVTMWLWVHILGIVNFKRITTKVLKLVLNIQNYKASFCKRNRWNYPLTVNKILISAGKDKKITSVQIILVIKKVGKPGRLTWIFSFSIGLIGNIINYSWVCVHFILTGNLTC